MKLSRHTPVILAALALLGGASCSKTKTDDAGGDAMRKATLLALKANPDVEILKTDDAKGEVTYRVKKSGEQVTMSFNDLAQGKFNMKVKNAKGEETTVDAGSMGAGGVTIKGPEGKVTFNADTAGSAPPAWVTPYPGATPAPGSVRLEKNDTLSGSFVSETKDSVVKVKEFFDAKLKEQGYKTEAFVLNADGKDSATVSGTKDDGKWKITVAATTGDGKTTVMLVYEGPKN